MSVTAESRRGAGLFIAYKQGVVRSGNLLIWLALTLTGLLAGAYMLAIAWGALNVLQPQL